MNRATRLATGAAALLMSVTVTTQSGTPRQPAPAASFALSDDSRGDGSGDHIAVSADARRRAAGDVNP